MAKWPATASVDARLGAEREHPDQRAENRGGGQDPGVVIALLGYPDPRERETGERHDRRKQEGKCKGQTLTHGRQPRTIAVVTRSCETGIGAERRRRHERARLALSVADRRAAVRPAAAAVRPDLHQAPGLSAV